MPVAGSVPEQNHSERILRFLFGSGRVGYVFFGARERIVKYAFVC